MDGRKGYPSGYRVLAGLLNSFSRLGLTTGMSRDVSGMQFVQEWRNRMRTLMPIPPILVNKGPVMENVTEGDQVDLFKFPASRYHEQDEEI